MILGRTPKSATTTLVQTHHSALVADFTPLSHDADTVVETPDRSLTYTQDCGAR